ncbi:hypothetical protein ILP97_22080 [Amycolatopsis sp. H6(2020)]|nr:hypothetical protein [Amycolatopsis sp. H6(2020)]
MRRRPDRRVATARPFHFALGVGQLSRAGRFGDVLAEVEPDAVILTGLDHLETF